MIIIIILIRKVIKEEKTLNTLSINNVAVY